MLNIYKTINCRIMRKLIIWLAKVFKVDITTEKVVIKEVVKEILVSLNENEVINGDVTIKGNLIVNGSLVVEGEVSAYKIKGGE